MFQVAVLTLQSDLYLLKTPFSVIENAPAASPRALYLSDHEGSADEQLATLQQGLLVSEPHDPVHGELIAHQITTFIGDQQHQEALTAAHHYLTLTDSPRAQSIRNVAVQLAVSLNACEEAKTLVQGGDVEPASAQLTRDHCP